MPFETIEIKTTKGKQAVIIPEFMHFKDGKAYIKKLGNSIQIIPVNNAWSIFFESLNDFSNDFMNDRDQGDNLDRESFD